MPVIHLWILWSFCWIPGLTVHPCSRLNPGCGLRNTYQVSNEDKHKEPTLCRNCMPYTSGDFFLTEEGNSPHKEKRGGSLLFTCRKQKRSCHRTPLNKGCKVTAFHVNCIWQRGDKSCFFKGKFNGRINGPVILSVKKTKLSWYIN